MIAPCPCHNCPERFTACSDRCPKDARGEFGHKAWTKQRQEQLQYLKDIKNRWSIVSSAARDKIRYAYTKAPRKG